MRYFFPDGGLPSINKLPSGAAPLILPTDITLIKDGETAGIKLKFGDELLYPDEKGKIIRMVICPVDHGTMENSIARVTKLRDLIIATRTLNALEAAGFYTAGEVHDVSDADLLSKANFGKRDLIVVRSALQAIGLEQKK